MKKRILALLVAAGMSGTSIGASAQQGPGDAPGGPSRWNRGKSSEWVSLKPELVAEVVYDQVTGGRFRHGTNLVRWRPDKAPRQCTMEQLKQKRSRVLALLA